MRPIRYAMAAVAVVAGVAGVHFPARATPSSAADGTFALERLGYGTDLSEETIPFQFGTDVVMVRITVQPGGYSGWHSHPGGAIVVVEAGDSVTVYRSIGSQCQISTYHAGDAFIERPGEVDQVVNTTTGKDPYVLVVTFPRVPPGDDADQTYRNTRQEEDNPGTCPPGVP